MTANFDASSSDNWTQVFTGSYEATYIPGKATKVYVPIEPTELNVNLDSPLIAIYCTSTDYPNSQKYLGSIVQQVKLPGFFPVDAALGRGRGIYSNQTVLAKFTEFDDSYSLLLRPKYYVEQLSVTIYKYVGSTYFVLEERLNTLEAKVDQVSTKIDLGVLGQNQTLTQQTVTSVYLGLL